LKEAIILLAVTTINIFLNLVAVRTVVNFF